MQELHPEQSLGTPARYGHSCTNCARAKCKCIYRVAGGDCERCHRLNKECQPSVCTRKRNARKTQTSRKAHIEEKLNDLVSLLRSQVAAKTNGSGPEPVAQSIQLSPESSPNVSLSEQTVSTAESTTSPRRGCLGCGCLGCDGSVPSHTGPLIPGSGSSSSISVSDGFPEFNVPDHVAEENLDRFRRDLVRFGPVVYIPPETTAKELRRSRPVLWLSIMVNTTKSCAIEQAMGEKFRSIVAHKIVLDHDRSMDLLQGLVLYLLWTHAHKKERPYLSTWTQLALAMAQDLGLHKLPPGEDRSFLCVNKYWFSHKDHKPPPPTYERTMEERRTVLGVFVLSNMVSQILRRINALGWTPHMDHCLRVLTEQPECEGDLILAVQVRCALITEQITNSYILHDPPPGETGPPTYFTKALQSQLHDIKRSLPASIANYETVILHLYCTELCIHEFATNTPWVAPPLSADPAAATLATGGMVTPQLGTPSYVNSLQHLEDLHICYRAIENCMTVIRSIQTSAFPNVSFTTFAQIIHGIVILRRLSATDKQLHPAWDPVQVRQKFNYLDLLAHFAAIFEAVPAASGIVEDGPEESIWLRGARSLKMMEMGWRAEQAAESGLMPARVGSGDGLTIPEENGSTAAIPAGDDGLAQAAGVSGVGVGPEGLRMEDMYLGNFGDDPWLSEFFIPWDA